MANSWGELSWGLGDWGTQNDTLIIPTGTVSSVSVNSIDYAGEPNGWGQFTWGFNEWGDLLNPNVDVTGLQLNTSVGNEEAFTDVSLTLSTNLILSTVNTVTLVGGSLEIPIGIQINSTINSVFAGENVIVEVTTPGTPTEWGSLAWGQGAWNQISGVQVLQGDESISATGVVDITGVQSNISIGISSVTADANLNLNTNLLNVTTGTVNNIIDVVVEVTTNLIQISIGDESISATGVVDITGVQSNTSTGAFIITGDANLSLNTNLLNITASPVLAVIDITVEVTTPGSPTTWGNYAWGQQAWGQIIGLEVDQGAEEVVVPSIEVDVIGVQLNTTIGSLSIVADANVTPNTNLLTTSLGDEDVTPNTIVVLSTNLLNASVGNASGQALVDVDVTGVNMTTSTGRLYISAWAVINIGVSNTWSVVDIAA